MNIDISTLVIVSAITNFLQVIALALQYRVDKTHHGIGWWMSGFAMLAIGYCFLFLRDIISIKLITVISANTLIISGLILIYIGVMRFLEKNENRRFVISIFTGVILALFYLTYFKDDITLRTVIMHAAAAAISFLTARSMFVYRPQFLTDSAYFNASLFLIGGCFYSFRALDALAFESINGLFTPTVMQSFSFTFTFVQGILVTFGLIIMVNQRLNAENTEAKENLELIFNTSPDAVLITRLDDGHFVKVNEGFTLLSGFTRADVIGKSAMDVNIWKNPPERAKIIAALNEKGFCDNAEAVFQRKDESQFTGFMSARIITLQGAPHIISVTRDITGRKQAENKIRDLLAEKELTLKEVHHRIKNNMNTVASIMWLQADTLKEPTAIAALEDARSRVMSMMLLYDKLYRADNFHELSFREYISPLIDEIIDNFPNKGIVRIEKKLDDFILGTQKSSNLGIIINELLTNIMKYAFKGRNDGLITVYATAIDKRVKIVVRDNGVGINESFDIKNSGGFGLQLVDLMVQQLSSTVKIERNNGTAFIFEFDK